MTQMIYIAVRAII